VNRVLGAIGGGLNIRARSANRIAGCECHTRADQDDNRNLLKHDRSLLFNVWNDHDPMNG
jgi:hypothetical protein